VKSIAGNPEPRAVRCIDPAVRRSATSSMPAPSTVSCFPRRRRHLDPSAKGLPTVAVADLVIRATGELVSATHAAKPILTPNENFRAAARMDAQGPRSARHLSSQAGHAVWSTGRTGQRPGKNYLAAIRSTARRCGTGQGQKRSGSEPVRARCRGQSPSRSPEAGGGCIECNGRCARGPKRDDPQVTPGDPAHLTVGAQTQVRTIKVGSG